jgi:2-polyprenyl-6-hydroxyphenyl methylase/3-demethylubiquinone-9 3-methyltransferase
MPVDNQLYDRAADIWWDEDEPLSMLRTMLNPVRIGFFRDVLKEAGTVGPFGTALDMGCGGGLMSEEIARLDLRVTESEKQIGGHAPALIRTHSLPHNIAIDCDSELEHFADRILELMD